MTQDDQHMDDQATPPSGYQVPESDKPHAAAEQSDADTSADDGGAQESGANEPSVDEQAPLAHTAAVKNETAAADPNEGGDEEYKWHTTRTGRSETAESDAVEFIDVKKSFGRNTVLNGLNLGIPDGQISMILGPSGTGKSVCIKHMVGLLYPDEGDVMVHGESVPNMKDDDLF
ncbi:MAG: phospholipid/cholesterol/gamma-HCH transport system ATP-binding protein, partial [Thermoleophilaceae bacterium]|nr:phospholipid/cholesterol/gamma-HCH transport system ATP-binding protein [Thermoleophilaceae bacterium]